LLLAGAERGDTIPVARIAFEVPVLGDAQPFAVVVGAGSMTVTWQSARI